MLNIQLSSHIQNLQVYFDILGWSDRCDYLQHIRQYLCSGTLHHRTIILVHKKLYYCIDMILWCYDTLDEVHIGQHVQYIH